MSKIYVRKPIAILAFQATSEAKNNLELWSDWVKSLLIKSDYDTDSIVKVNNNFYLHDREGYRYIMQDNDWLVKDRKLLTVMPDEEFRNNYYIIN